MAASVTDNQAKLCVEVMRRMRECVPVSESLVPLHAPSFLGNEWNYVKECLDSGWVSSVGKFVDRFESELADYIGSKHCIATANGTVALHAALILAGVEPNDEVLVPDLTFAATANAVVHASALPHFVDVSEKTLAVDAVSLESYLSEIAEMRGGQTYNRLTGNKLSALIVMHTFGHPAEMDRLVELCERLRLVLIEDAAESIGSYYKDKHTGRFGRLAVLSFNGNKTITTGGGGAILTDDDELAKEAKHLTTTAKVTHRWRFYHDRVGYNYRMPNINAALGCAQLEQLSALLVAKRKLAQRYINAFADLAGVKLFREPVDCVSNYWLNTLIFDDESGESLEMALETTNSRGIQTRPAWDLMHTLPHFQSAPRMTTRVSNSLAARILCLPSSPSLGMQ